MLRFRFVSGASFLDWLPTLHRMCGVFFSRVRKKHLWCEILFFFVETHVSRIYLYILSVDINMIPVRRYLSWVIKARVKQDARFYATKTD